LNWSRMEGSRAIIVLELPSADNEQ